MKKLFTLLAFVITITTFAQAPQGFNYQATVRNSSGALIINQNVNFRFNIMLNSQTSMPVFSETHMAPTDDLGQVNLVIGTGTATTGSFANINWGTGNYFLGIELNTGSGYVAMGTTQLLSVPYALYANSAGNAQAPTPDLATVLAVNNGANNLQIKNLADPTEAQDAVTKNYVDTEIANIQISSQGKTSIYLTGNITDAQAATKITAEFGPFTENIYIRNTTQLTNVDLSALVTISNITIENNSNLANINLSNLSTIEDEFRFYSNAAFSTLSFPALLNCSSFVMSNSNGLTSLNFPLLSYINNFNIGYYEAGNNATLANLNLPSVQTIGGRFELKGLSSLTSLTFPMLHTLTGNILIEGDYMNDINITSFSFPALTSCLNINGEIGPGSIRFRSSLPATINFSALTTCNIIYLYNASSLNFSSLTSCSYIEILYSPSLTSLSFPSLTNNSNLSLGGNALTSNSVNSLLNKFLTVLPASGKNINLEGQIPPAPPTGQGIIDKQTLINAGNSVTTDGFLPTVTTSVFVVSGFSALCGGTITNDGGGTIQGSGIVWATTANPTLANNVLYNGASNVTISINITGLNPGTTYFVRAFATTSSGTAFGNEISFSTLSVLPTLTTTEATSITFSSATSGGNITSNGGANATARGVCWSTSANPTILLTTKTVDGSGIGIFTSNLTGLTAGTTYYVRAYATNGSGTAYGNEMSFTTLAAILPTLTTSAITSITSTSATSGGTITNDGGAAITARGIVWGTTTNPTIGSNLGITTNGTSGGAFTSNLTALIPGTTYFVRAYATNTVGTAYGDQFSFQSLIIPGTVQTFPVTSITATSATCGWNITDLGGGSLGNGYLIWSITPNPTLNTPNVNTYAFLGSTTHSMTNLLPNTTYYVRSVVITFNNNQTEQFTGYGNIIVFTTLDTPNITIGTQIWSNTNLDVTSYRDGTPIPQVTDPTQWANLTTGAWCYYNNDTANGAIYGKLYNWYAVAGIHDNNPATPNKILAPTGWHIPTDSEWTTQTVFLGGEQVAGGKMKTTGTSQWLTPNTGATNESGFSGLPGGVRDDNGSFFDVGYGGNWWSSSDDGTTNARHRGLDYNASNASWNYDQKRYGLSVRCIKD